MTIMRYRKPTAATSSILVHQRLPAMLEFSVWPFVVLREPVVFGRRGRGVRLCRDNTMTKAIARRESPLRRMSELHTTGITTID